MPLSGDRALRSFVAGPCAARQRAAWGMGAFLGGRNLGIRVNTRSPGARGQSPDRCPDRAGGPLRPRLAVAGGRRTPGSGLSNETGRGTFWWPRPLLVTTPWPTRWQCNVRLFHFPPQGLQNREYARSRELNLPARHERRLSGGPSGGPSEPMSKPGGRDPPGAQRSCGIPGSGSPGVFAFSLVAFARMPFTRRGRTGPAPAGCGDTRSCMSMRCAEPRTSGVSVSRAAAAA